MSNTCEDCAEPFEPLMFAVTTRSGGSFIKIRKEEGDSVFISYSMAGVFLTEGEDQTFIPYSNISSIYVGKVIH